MTIWRLGSSSLSLQSWVERGWDARQGPPRCHVFPSLPFSIQSIDLFERQNMPVMRYLLHT